MMIGLSSLVNTQPGDICLDINTGTTAPCSSGDPNFLCYSSPDGGSWGTCGSLPGGAQIPILHLADVMARCADTNCQIVSAAPTPFATGGPCDPLIMAAGYACQGRGYIATYQKQTGAGGNLANGTLYTSQGPIAAPSANQYYLTPQQTGYLIDSGIVAPVTSMNAPLTPLASAPPPTTGPGAAASVLYTYSQTGQPQVANLPFSSSAPPSAPMTPAPTGPLTVALGIPPAPSSSPSGGMMPGGGTASSTGGPAAAVPIPAASGSGTTGTSSDLISGIDNKTLLIGAGALVLLLAVMK